MRAGDRGVRENDGSGDKGGSAVTRCALPSPAHAPGAGYKRGPDLQITDGVRLG